MTSSIFHIIYCVRYHSQPRPNELLCEFVIAPLSCKMEKKNTLNSLSKALEMAWAILGQTGIDLKILSGRCMGKPTSH